MQKKALAIQLSRQQAKDEIEDRIPEVQVSNNFKKLNQHLVEHLQGWITHIDQNAFVQTIPSNERQVAKSIC